MIEVLPSPVGISQVFGNRLWRNSSNSACCQGNGRYSVNSEKWPSNSAEFEFNRNAPNQVLAYVSLTGQALDLMLKSAARTVCGLVRRRRLGRWRGGRFRGLWRGLRCPRLRASRSRWRFGPRGGCVEVMLSSRTISAAAAIASSSWAWVSRSMPDILLVHGIQRRLLQRKPRSISRGCSPLFPRRTLRGAVSRTAHRCAPEAGALTKDPL